MYILVISRNWLLNKIAHKSEQMVHCTVHKILLFTSKFVNNSCILLQCSPQAKTSCLCTIIFYASTSRLWLIKLNFMVHSLCDGHKILIICSYWVNVRPCISSVSIFITWSVPLCQYMCVLLYHIWCDINPRYGDIQTTCPTSHEYYVALNFITACMGSSHA